MTKLLNNGRMPVKVFLSYSHKDEKICERLMVHLSPLRREGSITDWYDRKILPGDDWENDIDQHLRDAQIILLLVSADFINSNYCYVKEMKLALKRHKNGNAVIIPIIIRHCDWGHSPLKSIQALPKDGRPVTAWSDEDEAFLNVVQGLRVKINALNSSTTSRVIKVGQRII